MHTLNPGARLFVTIAICTWNRSQLLRKTFESLERMTIPDGIDWELIVVDNNSTDETSAVLAEFVSRLPLQVVSEPNAGLSHARNAALAHVHGTYIIWTDDDVLVDPGWLAAYVDAFQSHEGATVFGGPILPWFEGDPPSWLRMVLKDVEVAYAVRDFDSRNASLSESNMPFGANMAFTSSLLTKYAFDVTLGRIRGGLVGGEETAIIRSMLSSGHVGCWVSGARIQHYIPRSRQTARYLREWYAGYGRMLVRLDAKSSGAVSQNRPRWIWREWITAELLFIYRRIWATPTEWIIDLKRASIARGQFEEYGVQQRSAR